MEASSKPREFHFPNAEKLLDDKHACLNAIERTVPIRMPPKYLGKPREFVRLVLNNALGHYNYDLQCIPVSYRRVRQLGTIGVISGEDPNSYFSVLVEYVVFQPIVGSRVAAKVEKVSKSHVGLLAHGWFNCSITEQSPDDAATRLCVGDEVIVEVLKIHINKRLMSLECRLDSVVRKADGSQESDEATRAPAGKPNSVDSLHQKSPKKKPSSADSGVGQVTPDHSAEDDVPDASTTKVKVKTKKKSKRKRVELEEDEELASPVAKKRKGDRSADESLVTEETPLDSITDTGRKKKKKQRHADLDQSDLTENNHQNEHRHGNGEVESADNANLTKSLKKKKKKRHPSGDEGLDASVVENTTPSRKKRSKEEAEPNEVEPNTETVKSHKKKKKHKSDKDMD